MTTTYLPPGGDPTAVLGRRIGAYVIDILLVTLILAPIAYTVFMDKSVVDKTGTVECVDEGDDASRGRVGVESTYCFHLGDETRYLEGSDANEFTAILYGAGFVILGLNVVVLQALTGASVGKHLVGLRVVRQETGQKAGFGWMVLRYIFLYVDSFCCGIPGIVTSASTKGHRRIGDLVAGTLVVDKRALGGPILVPGLNAPAAYGYGVPGAPGYGAPTGDWGGQQPNDWNTPSTGAGPAAWPQDTGADQPSVPTASTDAGMSASPSADNPSWDEARQAYIQYDRELSAWMQWDDAAKKWKPISQ